MGVYFKYYIEYRTKDDRDWQLVSFHNPVEKLMYNNDKQYVTHDYIQGVVRDVFSSRGFQHAPFCNRGFPNNLSIELKDVLDSEYQERLLDAKTNFESQDIILDEELYKKSYKIEYIPRNRDFDIKKDFVDDRYDKTYCILNELDAFQQKKLRELEKNLANHQDNIQFDALNRKLDSIIDLLQDKHVKQTNQTKSDNNESEDCVLSELQDVIDEYKYFGEWICGISAIVNFYSQGWVNYDNIRIVGYLC